MPNQVPIGSKDLEEYYPFKLEQFRFLEEYAKDMDVARAAAACGVVLSTAKRWMTEEKFRAEVMELHDVWRQNLKMTAEHAAARHIKLMNKMEQDYDTLDVKDRAKMATPLAKMSDSYLKASGHYASAEGGTDAQVVINIDLGGDEKNDKRISISGNKVVDGEVIDG